MVETRPAADRRLGGTPLPATSRRQQVSDRLRLMIVEGVISPGEQLKQDQLARDFGISPGPVREALRQLESEGLVEHVPNRGVFVVEVTTDDLLGVLLPVRLAIESFAVTHLPNRAEVVDTLRRTVEQLREAAARDAIEEVNELDVRFHELTVRACTSTHAYQVWSSVQPRIRLQIHRLSRQHNDIHDVVTEHETLLDSIARNGDDLLATVEDHIVGSARRLLARERRSD